MCVTDTFYFTVHTSKLITHCNTGLSSHCTILIVEQFSQYNSSNYKLRMFYIKAFFEVKCKCII